MQLLEHSFELPFELSSVAVFAAAVFMLAGFVKGVLGMGLPTIAMGLLSVVMLPAHAAALLVVPSLVTNVFQIAGVGFWGLLRRLATLLVGLCAGIAAGAGWLTHQGPGASRITAGLGLALMVYALVGLFKVKLQVPPRHEAWLSPLMGLLTGLVTAATGVFVMPAVPYLQALGLHKDDLVRSLGICFLVATAALGLSLRHGGALDASIGLASLAALLPALGGMLMGQRLRQRLHPDRFKQVFLVGLLVLGGYLAGRSVL